MVPLAPFRTSAPRARHGGSAAPTMGRRQRSSAGAFTVLEAAIASAIITIFLMSLFALNSNMMHLLSSASQVANASNDLQQRTEQVRLANWQEIVDPQWISTALLGTMTDASVSLPGLTETITVSPYFSPTSTLPTSNPGSFTVTRSANGTVKVSPAGFSSSALLTQEMLQIDLAVTWPGWSRSRSRALTTLVSKWGVSK